MAPRFRLFGWVVLLAVGGLLTAESGQSRAQSLNDGWSALDNRYRTVSGRVRKFFQGDKFSPDEKADAEAIDLFAKYYTYGVYLRKLDQEPNGIRKDYSEFDSDVGRLAKDKNTQGLQPLADALSDAVAVHALEVIQLKQARPIHKIHNARILAKTAELGHAKLADTLIAALKDPQQNEGVRYWILKGLEALVLQVQPPESTPVLSKDQQAKCAAAILEFLEQLKGPSKNAAPEELDGFRLLRRQAIRALAKIHTPSFNDKVRPALVLARFAGNDERIQPPPRIDERMEAAIGLARMRSAQDKQYQADYATGQIAKCLGAFAQIAEHERADSSIKIHTRPWKVEAALLKDALAVLKANNDKNEYVSRVADRGSRLLDKIMLGVKTDDNERIWWLSPESDPSSKELFHGSADSTVKPAQPAEAAPEK
ncbi:MAG: hypothetical protein ACYC3I_12440 [Gemmataceae bacterium]